mmetsp:Transcript_16594/g.49823  ORF Transcript_16594/g.49823 Transcript_16594/m.49823 type:complete len:223 (+) Transcript_16594:209-877(+)
MPHAVDFPNGLCGVRVFVDRPPMRMAALSWPHVSLILSWCHAARPTVELLTVPPRTRLQRTAVRRSRRLTWIGPSHGLSLRPVERCELLPQAHLGLRFARTQHPVLNHFLCAALRLCECALRLLLLHLPLQLAQPLLPLALLLQHLGVTHALVHCGERAHERRLPSRRGRGGAGAVQITHDLHLVRVLPVRRLKRRHWRALLHGRLSPLRRRRRRRLRRLLP